MASANQNHKEVTMADVHWLHDFEDGLQKAGDAGKPLFLDFFKDG
jgi:hypothetical protein